MNSIWLDITRLGESGFLLPIGLLLLVWLIAMRCLRLAVSWALYFGTAVAIVVISKILFFGWGVGIRSLNFTGFSGHTMLAAAVFPTLAHLTFINARRSVRLSAISLGVAIALLVAISRIELGAHSTSEVVGGFLIGSSSAAAFIFLSPTVARARLPILVVLVALGLSAFAGLGRYAPSHHLIVTVALDLSGHQHAYRRDVWLAHPGIAPS